MSSIDGTGYNTAGKIRETGAMIATGIRKAGAIAMAIANSSDVISNYKKQRDVSNRALQIAEQQQAFTTMVYWPKELAFLAEFGTPEEIEQADVYGRRFAGHLIAPVARAFAQNIKKQKCSASRYCTSQYARVMQSLYQAQATVVTNAKIMGFCMGFAYARAKDDLNTKRRQQALAISKGLFEVAANLYRAAAGGLAAGGAEAMTGLNDAIRAFGNASARTNQTLPAEKPSGANMPYSIGTSNNGFNATTWNPTVNGQTMHDMDTSIMDTMEWARDKFSSWGMDDESDRVSKQLSDMNKEHMTKFGELGWHTDDSNDADIGYRSLAHTGEAIFPVEGGMGGMVRVKMNQFGLAYTDPWNYTFKATNKADAKG